MAKHKKENEDEDQENQNQSDDSADNFGLPDIDYKPLDRTEPIAETPDEIEREKETETIRFEEAAEPEHVDYLEDEEEQRSNAPIIIGIVIVLIIGVLGYFGYKYYTSQAEKAKIELAKKTEADRMKKEQDDKIAKEKEEAEQKRLADEAALKAKPVEGTIETLSARTQRFYVVLASDIDDDLIMDYAKRLSAKGTSTKIVPPFGTTKFYRLAMGDYDSYASAQSGADAAKGEFGAQLWVIKY